MDNSSKSNQKTTWKEGHRKNSTNGERIEAKRIKEKQKRERNDATKRQHMTSPTLPLKSLLLFIHIIIQTK
jgi:hypothetical protein